MKREIDEIFEEWSAPETPGAAISIVQGGEVIYAKGYGSAQVEYAVPITPDTIFHAASVSKQFTAFGIALLVDEGRLSFDDDLRMYLPDLHDFGHVVTLRHLLNHTSGLRDQWALLALAGWRLDDVITQDHLVKLARNQRELNFEPGHKHLYSNTGYTLLAEIIVEVAGETFSEWMKRRVFEPLGMSSTHFHDDHQHIVPGRAYSYLRDDNGQLKNSPLNYANVGATSLFTTTRDLALWLENFERMKVGNAGIMGEMMRRGASNDGKALNYALGLRVGIRREQVFFSHNGADAGFRSNVAWYPEARLGIAVLGNIASLDASGVTDRIADLLLGAPDGASPEGRHGSITPVEIDLARLDDYVAEFELEDIPGFVLRFFSDGERLNMEDKFEGVRKMTPVGPDEFISDKGATRVVFERNGSDGIDSMMFVGRRSHPGRKVEPSAATVNLKSCTGRFYSNELETSYTIEDRPETLIAKHQRHPDITLKPLGGDRFAGDQWFMQLVEFGRSEDGEVSGFNVSSGRVMNLKFVRQ